MTCVVKNESDSPVTGDFVSHCLKNVFSQFIQLYFYAWSMQRGSLTCNWIFAFSLSQKCVFPVHSTLFSPHVPGA